MRNNAYHSGTIKDVQFTGHVGVEFSEPKEMKYFSNIFDNNFIDVISDHCPQHEMLQIGVRVCVKIPSNMVRYTRYMWCGTLSIKLILCSNNLTLIGG